MRDPFYGSSDQTTEVRFGLLFNAVQRIPSYRQRPPKELQPLIWYDETQKKLFYTADDTDQDVLTASGTTTSSGSGDVDGGSASAVYVASQILDGGTASG